MAKKELSWKEAVLKVLKEEKEPVHYGGIAQKIEEKQYRTSLGATPQVSVSVALQNLLKDGKVVTCQERGRYILKEYEKEYLKGNPIEPTINTMIGAYGRFWRREKVEWKTNGKTELKGNQGKGSIDVNFSEEIGIYLLHRGYEIVYIGQATKQSIVSRLEQHTKDDLANKWDTFSWFGFFNVNEENGKINTSCKSIKMDLNKVAETLEALLIESIEPRFNRKRGDNFSDKEYQQTI